jgi:hypothetical protein
VYTQEVVFPVGTWLSLVEHSLGVRGVGSSNLPVPTIKINHLQENPACIASPQSGADAISALPRNFLVPRVPARNTWDAALNRDNGNLIDGGEEAVRVALFGHPVMRRNWT